MKKERQISHASWKKGLMIYKFYLDCLVLNSLIYARFTGSLWFV